MVKNLKRTLALMLSIIMIMSSTLMTYAEDGGFIASSEAETSAQVEETVAAEAETSTKTPEAEASTQKTQAAPAAEAVEAVKPEITGQPEDAAVRLNDEAVFSLETNGQVKSCQWQTAKAKDGAWSNLNRREYGSSETLKIRAVKKYDKRFFRCIVTFKDGTTAKSEEARLSIVENESFPAQNFGSVKDTKVVAPEGAFPAGTTMEAEEVEDTAAVQSIIDDMDDVDGSVLNAVDISFYNGGEIQPKEAVKVTMNVGNDVDFDNLVLVHINADADQLQKDNLKTETIDFTYDKEAGTITFNADSFSTYTLIDTVVILDSEGSFDFDTADYKVTVSYTKEAGIPAGTELTVSQIPYDSDEYWDYWNKSFEKINEDATWVEGSEVAPDTRKGIAAAAFFDISLNYNGQEFEPTVPLQVEIKLKKDGLLQIAGEDTKIVHFAKQGTEVIDDVDVAGKDSYEGMPDGTLVDEITFEQTGFSVDGVITTDEFIDFEKAEYLPNLNETSDGMLRALGATRAAGDVSINAGKTVTDSDGDGIYELALNVKATSDQSSTTDVTKSNVVMVIDVSGSMGTDNMIFSEYTYDAATYSSNNRYYSSTSTNWQGNPSGTRLYYRNGAWRTSNSDYGTVYTGTVYAYETRLSATKRAANAVVDALLAYNKDETTPDGVNLRDIFEITVVKFANRTATGSYNGTQTVIKDSTNATAIKNAINALNAGGGTNWQAALELAKTEADYFKPGSDSSTDPEKPENTSVIFLTDGFPSYYGTDQGTGSDGNANNVQTSYNNSRAAARAIVNNTGYKLYNIFAFGSDTLTRNGHTGYQYLQALTNWAYTNATTDNYNASTYTSQYTFNARSTAELIAAFKTIIDHITNNVGFAGVDLSDGVSLGATSTSVAVNGTAKEESMRYTVKDDTDKLAYTVKINSSGAATFTIYNADGSTTTLTDNTAETVTTTINGTTITSKVYSVSVGSGDNAKTYKISPATIDADTGMVHWDLAGLGILESGYTYTVAFDVWANQLAYDIAADLNNGLFANVEAALDAYSVTDATERQHIKDAIVHNDDGSYSLYTNYSQQVAYYPATSHTDEEGNTTWEYGDKQTQNLPQPDPIPLKGSLLPFEKAWEAGLSQSELDELLWVDGVEGGTSKEYKITLYIWKADTKAEAEQKANTGVTDTNKPYITEVLGWDSDNQEYVFTKSAAVAPGMMVNVAEAAALGFDTTDSSKLKIFTNEDGETITYYVVESGHYYFVTEDGSDLHFELNAPIYHPMIVDGTLYNVGFGEGQTVEVMDPMTQVTATNTLKGGLNIDKVVSTTQINVSDGTINNVTEPKENGIKTVTDEFTYEIQIWKEDANGTKAAVYTYDDQIKNGKAVSGSIGYRIFSKPKKDGDAISYDEQVRGSILTEDSQYAALANGNYATIANGVTTITLTMPANGEIRLVNLPSGTKYSVKEIEDDNGSYNYAATNSQMITEEGTSAGTVTTANTVTGTIEGNKASLETYYNWAANFYVYHSKDNTIEKISFADERVKGTFENNTYKYTFNLVNETKTGSLYGGYFSAYGGQKMTDAQIVAATYDQTGSSGGVYNTAKTDGIWAKDTGATAYTGSSATAWKSANALKVNGLAMNPGVSKVYYLKEVPKQYISPYIYYVYDEVAPSHDLKRLYMITDTDDKNYDEVGILCQDTTDDRNTKTLYASIKVNKDGQDTVYETLTAKNLSQVKVTDFGSVPRGYLANWDTRSLIAANKEYLMLPYWITLDGVTVTGVSNRTVSIGDATYKVDGSTGGLSVSHETVPSTATKK